MKIKNKKSGFTLVELMIVAAIIAILAAIIIPLLAANRDRAVAADGQNLLGTTATALKVLYAEGDSSPTIAELPALTVSEIGKSKYFATPTITAIAGGTTFTFTLSASPKAAVGGFTTADTLTLNDTGAWGGTIATALKL